MAVGHSVDPDRWRAVLDEAVGRIAGRFVRREPRAAAAAFVTGLLSTVERKTCWSLAEQAGFRHPARLQRLLRTAVWDADKAAGDVRGFVADRLGHPDGVLIADETGFVKKGTCSVGVQRQYTGAAGRIENSQVGACSWLTRARTAGPWLTGGSTCPSSPGVLIGTAVTRPGPRGRGVCDQAATGVGHDRLSGARWPARLVGDRG